jgi:hypothetical protein
MSTRMGMFALGLLGVFVAASAAEADPYRFGGYGGGFHSYQYGGYGGGAPGYYGGPGYYGAQPGFSRGGWNPTTSFHYSSPRVTAGFGFQSFGYGSYYGGNPGFASPYRGFRHRRW